MRERPNALLVDDNPQVLMTLGLLFQAMGWNTSKAEHSEQAMPLLLEQNFDLAILDLKMPDVSGIELCRMIRSKNKLNPSVIFILSGHVTPQARAEAESAGVQAILNKPIGLNEMKAVLEKFGLPCGT